MIIERLAVFIGSFIGGCIACYMGYKAGRREKP